MSGPPDGLAATVMPGLIPGLMTDPPIERVEFGDNTLPEFFSIAIEPDPVPEIEDERWNLLLVFQVRRGENTSDLRYAECAERDLDSVLRLVREQWPLSTWRSWAHMILLLGSHTPHLSNADRVSSVITTLREARPKVRRRTNVTDEHLAEVADVYLKAPQKPTAAVKEHFTTSHSTAARWVGLARKAGLLPPVE